MPTYDEKEPFEVYNVVSAKDAFAVLKKYLSNSGFNTQAAENFFKEEGVTVWGLKEPAYRLCDRVNEESVKSPEEAKKRAAADRKSGRSK